MRIGLKMSEYKNENQVKIWVFYGKKVGKYKNFFRLNIFRVQFFYAYPGPVHFTLLTDTGMSRAKTIKMRPHPGASTVDICDYIKPEYVTNLM